VRGRATTLLIGVGLRGARWRRLREKTVVGSWKYQPPVRGDLRAGGPGVGIERYSVRAFAVVAAIAAMARCHSMAVVAVRGHRGRSGARAAGWVRVGVTFWSCCSSTYDVYSRERRCAPRFDLAPTALSFEAKGQKRVCDKI
jgi:hypothetical protein